MNLRVREPDMLAWKQRRAADITLSEWVRRALNGAVERGE
jgi:hypothetical protein